MTSLLSTLTAAVFVTTVSAAKSNEGKWFELNDYDNRADFMTAATDYIAAQFKAEPSDIRFTNNSLNFETMGMVNQHDIQAEVWGLLAINDEAEICLLNAYIAEFGMVNNDTKQNDIQGAYQAAKAKHQGVYHKQSDFVLDYLNSNGLLDNVSPLIKDNLDLAAIGLVVMKDFTESYSYYFINELVSA